MASLETAPPGAGAWATLKHPLPSWLVDALHAKGFTSMTPVQAASINALLSHKDVIVEAPTGSGKTLAYLLPLLAMLEASGLLEHTSSGDQMGAQASTSASTSAAPKSSLAGLVICPTRELAAQVHRVLVELLALRSSPHSDAQADAPPQEALHGSSEEQHEEQELTEAEERDRLSSQSRHGALLVVGGASRPEDDYRRFRNDTCRIVVGTPGRVLNLVERKTVDTKSLELVVLDEGDRLMDAGFSADVESILNYLPKQRRSALYSATMTDAITRLASLGLRNPARIVVSVKSSNAQNSGGHSRAPAALSNFYTVSEPHARLWDFVNLLRLETTEDAAREQVGARKVIVYFATCAQVDYFYKVLSRLDHLRGLQLYSLHGQQTPSRRSATFEAFVKSVPTGLAGRSLQAFDSPYASAPDQLRSRKQEKSKVPAMRPQAPIASVLMCTDVAARGLDLPDVDLVVQFDAPTDPKVYAHRAGRTARAGKAGRAVVMLEAGRPEEFSLVMGVRKLAMQLYPHELPKACVETPRTDYHGTSALTDAEGLSTAIRSICLADREIYELSMRAFVSYVRAYSKHELSYIFRAKDMDLGAVARCFGLVRMPRMPEVQEELKRREATVTDGAEQTNPNVWGFTEAEVDLKAWAYLDPQREAQRLESLAAKEAKLHAEREALGASEGAKKDSSKLSKRKRMRGVDVQENAWCKQKDAKAVKEERKSKKARKREYLKRVALEKEEAAKAQKDQEKSDDDELDWLAEENEEKRKLRKARKEKQALALQPPEQRVEVAEAGFFDGL